MGTSPRPRERSQVLNATNMLKDGAAKVLSRAHSCLYTRSGGRLGSKFRKAPVLLLTTTGRKSGKARTAPLLYLRDGERLVVVASYGGDDRAPAWFHNLVADPQVTVEIGRTKRTMSAALAEPADRERLWSRLVAMYGSYENYQKRTDREIPVIFLSEVPEG